MISDADARHPHRDRRPPEIVVRILLESHGRGADRGASLQRVKVGIVVPFSWSYWGGVVEHAENQARGRWMELGHDARILIGNDPPGLASRLLHPRGPAATRSPRRS